MKPWSPEIGGWNYRIALKFDWRLGSTAAEELVIFQSDRTILNTKSHGIETARSCDITFINWILKRIRSAFPEGRPGYHYMKYTLNATRWLIIVRIFSSKQNSQSVGTDSKLTPCGPGFCGIFLDAPFLGHSDIYISPVATVRCLGFSLAVEQSRSMPGSMSHQAIYMYNSARHVKLAGRS